MDEARSPFAGAPADIETASEDYASRFSGAAGQYLLSVQEQCVHALLAPYSGGNVLEIGGGHCQLLALYARLGMQVTLHGSSTECFSRLPVEQLPEIRTLTGDFMRLDLPDQSYDVVIAVRLVSHVDEWTDLLSEMARIARHAIIIDYPSLYSLNALSPLLFQLKKNIEGNTRTYLSFSRRQLAAKLSDCGLPVIHQRKQFLLPMAIHRAGRSNPLFRGTEHVGRKLGLTAMLGSPVILRAARLNSNG